MYLFLCKEFRMKRELLLKFNKPIEKCCWLCENKENLVEDLDGLYFCYDARLHIDKGFPKFKLFDEMKLTFRIDLERAKL